MTQPKVTFHDWFALMVKAAKDRPTGKLMLDAGYTIAHTGGGCLAWQRVVDDGKVLLWICDEGNGLGDKVDETYLVGLHLANSDESIGDEVPDLNAAIAWCSQAHAAFTIARRWVARIGGGFHPDTKGGSYRVAFGDTTTLMLDAEEIAAYNTDMVALFRAPGDPYEYAVLALKETGR